MYLIIKGDLQRKGKSKFDVKYKLPTKQMGENAGKEFENIIIITLL